MNPPNEEKKLEAWEVEFDRVFVEENYNKSDDEFTANVPIKNIKDFIRTQLKRAYEEGQQNPKVGFLRQYLNERPNFPTTWTDESIIEFLRIPFTDSI